MVDAHYRKYLIDPELQESLDLLLTTFPGGLNAPDTIEERRNLISSYLAQFPRIESVSRTDMNIESTHGGQHIPIRLYRPLDPTTTKHIDCALVMIHGGGMVM